MSKPHKDETFTEYRLAWTYPYLENRGEFRYAYGRSKEDARGNAERTEAFHYAGKELSWDKRTITVKCGEWGDDMKDNAVTTDQLNYVSPLIVTNKPDLAEALRMFDLLVVDLANELGNNYCIDNDLLTFDIENFKEDASRALRNLLENSWTIERKNG